MKDLKDLSNLGKHTYDKLSAEHYADLDVKTFSINIFQLVRKSNQKALKPSKGIVRVSGNVGDKAKVFEMADQIVGLLDSGYWDGRKTVKVK